MAVREVTQEAWQIGFQSLETEHGEEVELEVEGSLPAELHGRLYRVVPARFDVWLLVVVLNAGAGRSELRVYDGAEPAARAVATVPLPRVPFHFHGNWVGARQLAPAS